MKNQEANELKLAGRIVNKYETKDFVKLGIATSVTVRGERSTNYPTLFFFRDKDGRSPADDVLMGDSVTIYGHMSSSLSSRRHRDTYRMQQIVGDTLEPIETVYPDELNGHKGRKVELNANYVHLEGEVTQVALRAPNIVNVYIDAINKGVHNIISVTCYGRLGQKAEPGRKADINAFISTTRKKTEDGKFRYYQNVVAWSLETDKNKTVA